MAENQIKETYLMTQPAPNAYCFVVEARPFKGKNGKEKGEAKYQSTIVFDADHPDYLAMKALTLKLSKAKWPGKDVQAEVKERNFKLPFTSGDSTIAKAKKKAQDAGKTYDGNMDWLAGKILVKSSSKFLPQLSVFENKQIIELNSPELLAKHKKAFYSGVLGLSELAFVPYDAVGDDGKDGVTTYLQSFFSLNRGEKHGGGGVSAAEKFSAYAGQLSEQDPTAGQNDMDDDIPF